MTIRSTPLLAVLFAFAVGVAHAQSMASPPAGQTTQGMANMPGMGGGASADMSTMMKQCAQMKAQMKAGMTMTPDMQPMMDRCTKMDRSMGAAKSPDDTLSR